MTAETDDDILDALFHGCAVVAFVEQARQQQNWPDSEATRRRAYRHYEEALAEKNRRESRPEAVDAKNVSYDTKSKEASR